MLASIRNKMSKYLCEFKNPPSRIPTRTVVDAPIAGNGDIGVSLGGSTESLQIYISKNDFWQIKSCRNKGGIKSIGGLTIFSQKLKDAEYSARQDIYNGTLSTRFIKDGLSLETETYVDYNDNLIITKVLCKGESLEVKVDLWVTENDQAVTKKDNKNNIKYICKSFETSELPWPSKVAVAAKVIGSDSYDFYMKKDEILTIATCLYTNHDTPDYFDKTIEEISNIDMDRIKKQYIQHNNWWENFWSSSAVSVEGEPLIEKFWYGSHYIMASCSSNKKFPPGLFGNWITTDFSEWSGDYHLNYNHEAPWWGLYSSNMIETSKTYEAPLIDYIPEGRVAAEEIGCRGIYYVVGLGPKGTKISSLFSDSGEELGFWGQKCNAAWAAVNMIMRYYYTYDENYAQKTAYPYLLEVADFWETYLKFEDGRYVIYNDCSHEVAYWVEEIRVNGSEFANDFNPLLSLGLIRLVFKALLEISTTLGLDSERHEKWNHILDNISEFPTHTREGRKVFKDTEKGKEWPIDDNTLGIPIVFPLSLIGLDSDKEMLQTAIDTLELLDMWEHFNDFCMYFTARVRVGSDPNLILEKLNEQLIKHSFPNMFVFYGGGGIESCSAVPTCINEMLMQSHERIIKFFPVWPKNKNASFESLRAYGAFLVSAKQHESSICDISIYSEKGKDCTIQNPWDNEDIKIFKKSASGNITVDYVRNGSRIHFTTEPDELYFIEKFQ